MPQSLNTLKKVIMTVATAIGPKSSGGSIRARTAVTPNATTMPAYFAAPVYITPDTSSFFTDDIFRLFFL